VSERGWVPVGRAADVPELEGRSVQFGARRVAIFRLPAGWAAVDHACPHEGGPLADGIVADTCVTCPLHGWRFDLRTGARQGGAERLTTYDVRERDGLLELRVPDEFSLLDAA
jgi:nitrite reductase (NADH) small subunit